MRATPPSSSRTRPAERWYREKWSRAGHETPVAFLILGDPFLNLLLAERTKRRQFGSSRTQARGKIQDEFLFLFGTQLVGSSLDFSQRAHAPKLSA